ncbi:uncharacterized protein PgNI_00292 [Pyricularia grisea]|uniref:Ras-GAP domain-containing protein n=1 Tax=Pyricularia grisea TaxID=148305 RepID=A0A6P8BJY0_PYRGI|nr:uncharacterized protein PgNI_00292 [Pyricularia grisea]TLD16980.1 hypothetical protein PgNI_00292 [Pyricularia grisea]
MSHRPHPLRQSQTVDPTVLRYPSTASSSASSGYSFASEASRSSMSSISSGAYGSLGHSRAKSEYARPPISLSANNSPRSNTNSDNIYNSARQSLRPLPQPPGETSPTKRNPGDLSPTKRLMSKRHERGQSLDMSKLAIFEQEKAAAPAPAPPPRMGSLRPTSMLLTRSDTINRGGSAAVAHAHGPSSPPPLHHPQPVQLPGSDLEILGRSSTNQLRTLSKLAQSGEADEFAITLPAQEVVGLKGRRRLQRADRSNAGRLGQKSSGYGWEGRNWMDKQRQFLQAYEYLCHIGEAKEWIEDVINKSIGEIVKLEEELRNGETLAEVVQALNPDRRYRIFRHPRLQYRHSDNIAIFFRYLDEVELPDLFRFELIDLYEKKNIPKVIYCIHALSWLLYRKGIVDFRIGNLVGQLEFEHHDLEAMQKGLDKLGASMPTFGDMGADFGVEPEPEPEETEEERIERELGENEDSIVELQAQVRGALLRMRLGGTMQELWDSENWLVDLQARIRGDFARQIIDYRLNMRRFAVNLQSAARGFLVRSRQAEREYMWKRSEPAVLKLQSLFRAAKVRDEVRDVRSQLSDATGPVRDIQAVMRGFLARKGVRTQVQETSRTSGAAPGLQAAIRGMLLRNRLDHDRAILAGEAVSICGLQAAARALLTRKQVAIQRESLASFSAQWEGLQSASRGMFARNSIHATKAELREHSPAIGLLQAFARAGGVRRETTRVLDAIAVHEPQVVELQGLIRGAIQRQRIAADYKDLEEQIPQITDLQSQIRGMLCRKEQGELLDQLQSNEEQIITLQAQIRAMILRNNLDVVLAELEEQEETIVLLQAAARGVIVRKRFEEKKRHFKENMSKVIKIQSFVRGKLQGEAYKSLTTGKSPPVSAVKNFVHLLNDSDFDFNEEVEFERMRKTVVQQVRQNEMLEQYIDQLDIKIALLVKNKITLDEVVRHQNNFGGHTSNLIANSSIASVNQYDLKALNKTSRKKLESYQHLFYNLQTQPQYLARLFRRIREQGTAEKECKRIEHLIMGLFGYAQKRREEYYLLKLIARSIWEEVEASHMVQDSLRGNLFWSKLLGNYSRSPRDRKYLRDLLGPLIRDNIIEDPALDLESDPLQIYRSAINNEELRTGMPSQRPLDVPREVAIKDPETRELFIDHLRDLREICDQFLLALEDLLPRLPYGLRYICRQMFDALCQHFKREPQHILLQMVGNWFWRFYLQPALTAPENVGVMEKGLSPLQKRNLGEVAKVLGQVASGRPFGGDNIYLQPLNAFVAESMERLGHILGELISVADAESTFDIDEFNDLYAKNRPTLYIKLADIFAIHNLISSDLPTICPNRDDMLREIMQELGSAKNNESEMTATGSSDIQMFLTPKLHDVEDPEAEIKALFMETKRCILYIIRVQSGSTLLEILVKPVTQEDERKWMAVLHDDFSDGGCTKGAYSDVNMVDVTRMSYLDLKRTALENVMRLEHAGRISKHNHYQDILNAIALDIRTKSRRRVQRQRELDGVRMTLSNLHEKAKYLEQQRKSYDDYIEQAMATLQNRKGKKRFLLPFTKQYNHQRELERSGRVPKFGSYKYSARQLADKGVLVSWAGVSDRDLSQINLTISCDEVGVFAIEGSRGHIQIPGASALVPIEDLLQAQFESHQFMNLFEGNLRLNVNILLHLLYKKFYRTQ